MKTQICLHVRSRICTRVCTWTLKENIKVQIHNKKILNFLYDPGLVLKIHSVNLKVI